MTKTDCRLPFLLHANGEGTPQTVVLPLFKRRRHTTNCHSCSIRTTKTDHTDCHFCSMQTTKTYSRLPSFLYSKTKTYHRLPFLLDSNDEDRPQTAVLAPGNRRRQDYKLSYMFQATTKTEHTAISAPLTMTDDRLPTLLQRTDKNRL